MCETIFTIDGLNIRDFATFIDEFNRVFGQALGTKWHGNLDAFYDFLSWPGLKYSLRWIHSTSSQKALGYPEMVMWLEKKVINCHPSNVPSFEQRLEQAKNGVGPTMFDFLVSIIRDDPDVDLRLE